MSVNNHVVSINKKKFLILATLTVLVPPEPPMILNGEKLKTSEDTEIRLAFFSRNSVIIFHILSMHSTKVIYEKVKEEKIEFFSFEY
jgi:hypothetical protein